MCGCIKCMICMLSRAQLLCSGFCTDCLWVALLCNILGMLAKFNSSMLTQALNITGWREEQGKESHCFALTTHNPQLGLILKQSSRHLLSLILTGQVNHNTGKHTLLIVVFMMKWIFQEQGNFLELSGFVVKKEVCTCTCRHRQNLWWLLKWPF